MDLYNIKHNYLEFIEDNTINIIFEYFLYINNIGCSHNQNRLEMIMVYEYQLDYLRDILIIDTDKGFRRFDGILMTFPSGEEYPLDAGLIVRYISEIYRYLKGDSDIIFTIQYDEEPVVLNGLSEKNDPAFWKKLRNELCCSISWKNDINDQIRHLLKDIAPHCSYTIIKDYIPEDHLDTISYSAIVYFMYLMTILVEDALLIAYSIILQGAGIHENIDGMNCMNMTISVVCSQCLEYISKQFWQDILKLKLDYQIDVIPARVSKQALRHNGIDEDAVMLTSRISVSDVELSIL